MFTSSPFLLARENILVKGNGHKDHLKSINIILENKTLSIVMPLNYTQKNHSGVCFLLSHGFF